MKYEVPPPDDYAPSTPLRTAPTLRDVLYTLVLGLLVAFNVVGLLALGGHP